jgi:hypothetical protein
MGQIFAKPKPKSRVTDEDKAILVRFKSMICYSLEILFDWGKSKIFRCFLLKFYNSLDLKEIFI